MSRERIGQVAEQIADESGVAALTIRAIADRLGVKPMAIYHHVAGKEEILDDIVDAVFSQVYRPDATRPWRTELERRARSLRAALGSHPWAISLTETRRHPGPANLASHEALLDLLLTAGFSLAATAHAGAVIDAFVFGFCLQEAMLKDLGLDQDAAALLAGMNLADSPRLAQFAEQHVLRTGYAFADSFDVGLALVLDGIAALPDAPTGPPEGRPA